MKTFVYEATRNVKFLKFFFIGFYKPKTVAKNNFFARFFSLVNLLA